MPKYEVTLRGAEGEEVTVGVDAGGSRGAENLAKHDQASKAEGHRANPNYWTAVEAKPAKAAPKPTSDSD